MRIFQLLFPRFTTWINFFLNTVKCREEEGTARVGIAEDRLVNCSVSWTTFQQPTGNKVYVPQRHNYRTHFSRIFYLLYFVIKKKRTIRYFVKHPAIAISFMRINIARNSCHFLSLFLTVYLSASFLFSLSSTHN